MQTAKTPKAIVMFLLFTLGYAYAGSSQTAMIPTVSISEPISREQPPASFTAGIRASNPDSARYLLWFNNPTREKVTITVTSAITGTVFSKTYTDESFAQNFNFSHLDDGMYIIRICSGKKKIKRKLNIATETYAVRKQQLL